MPAATSKEWFNQEFWIELRKGMGIEGLGRGQCTVWCKEALAQLIDIEKSHPFLGMMTKIPTNSGVEVSAHYWLECDNDSSRYIADGTLGFISTNHQEKNKLKTIIDKSLNLTKRSSKYREGIKLSEEKIRKKSYKIKQKSRDKQI